MASASFSFNTQLIAPKNNSSTLPSFPGSFTFRQPLSVSAATATAQSPRSTTQIASLYEVLGIQMGATGQEIKAAYRRLARTVHPDIASRNQDETSSSADEFMRVHDAYTTLSDPEKRANYDRVLFRGRRPAVRIASSATDSSSYPRRTWETDQCW